MTCPDCRQAMIPAVTVTEAGIYVDWYCPRCKRRERVKEKEH